jgi:hypothetical protein
MIVMMPTAACVTMRLLVKSSCASGSMVIASTLTLKPVLSAFFWATTRPPADAEVVALALGQAEVARAGFGEIGEAVAV